MNALENWYCSTSFWRWLTRKRLLPWLLGRADLGNHLLEIGAGPGAATAELRKRVPRVTSLEYDYAFASRLAQKVGNGAGVVQGDAAALPFADRTFSSAVAVLVFIICGPANSRIAPSRKFTACCVRAAVSLPLKFKTDGCIASFILTVH